MVFIVFLSEIELGLANPRVHTLWARARAFHHPAVVCSTTTILKRMEEVDRKAVVEREADRERKRERARCAKEAGPEAIRKGKYPRCTQ